MEGRLEASRAVDDTAVEVAATVEEAEDDEGGTVYAHNDVCIECVWSGVREQTETLLKAVKTQIHENRANHTDTPCGECTLHKHIIRHCISRCYVRVYNVVALNGGE